MSENINLQEIIQRKILYKFDKLLNRFSLEYLKLHRGSLNEEAKKTLANLNDDIEQLQYDAFKYSAALASIQRDDLYNELELQEINSNIIATQTEIKNMQEQLRRQEIIKVNKEEFNCIAREVKNYDARTEMDKKIQEVDNEIKMLEEEHRLDMENIARQESYLTTALSAMACLVECNRKGIAATK